jgi:hypothetical protein
MVTGTVTVPHEAAKVALKEPVDFLDLRVNVAVPLAATVCEPPGDTCKSDGLLEVPVIVIEVVALWLMTTSVVPSTLSVTDPGAAVSVH